MPFRSRCLAARPRHHANRPVALPLRTPSLPSTPGGHAPVDRSRFAASGRAPPARDPVRRRLLHRRQGATASGATRTHRCAAGMRPGPLRRHRAGRPCYPSPSSPMSPAPRVEFHLAPPFCPQCGAPTAAQALRASAPRASIGTARPRFGCFRSTGNQAVLITGLRQQNEIATLLTFATDEFRLCVLSPGGKHESLVGTGYGDLFPRR